MNQDLDYWVKLGKNQEPSGAVPLFEMRPFEVRKPDGEIEYEDRIFVRIMNRGDSKTVIERFLRPEDEREFERELKAFRSQLEPEVDGIPLKEFPALTPADIANCRKRHIRSVEELASYPDTELDKLRQGHRLKHAAIKFLEFRGNPIRLQAANAKLEQQNAALEARLAALEARLENATDDGPEHQPGNGAADAVGAGDERLGTSPNPAGDRKKKRGRPRKSA